MVGGRGLRQLTPFLEKRVNCMSLGSGSESCWFPSGIIDAKV